MPTDDGETPERTPETEAANGDSIDDSMEGLDLDVYADVDRLTEEFRAQLAGPDAVTADAFAARHPDLAAVLLPALRALEALERGSGRPSYAGVLREGDRVGRFTIVGELGRGGMGVVYEASEEGLERTVALKVLDVTLASESFKQRFLREARAAARLEHPGIVPVYGTGEEGPLLWYAMRRIDGLPLDLLLHRMDDGSPADARDAAERLLVAGVEGSGSDASTSTSSLGSGAPGSARHVAIARVGQRLASALAYAHADGVLHRDVKPGNVMIDGAGQPHLTDFGLCKLEGEVSLTEASDVIGTLRYMPPEGLRQDVDVRGDVYALGLVLYELLTRRPAFERKERARLVHDIEHRDPVAPRRVDPAIPQDLARIVVKASAKLPEERYATAEAFAQDLGAFLAGKPIQARPLGLLYLLRLAARRHRAAALVAAVSAFALVTLGIAYVVQLQSLLRDVTDARREAEHGEAVALMSGVGDGLRLRGRESAVNLLQRVAEPERNWVWDHLSEAVTPLTGGAWLPIPRPLRCDAVPDGTLLAWGRREVQLIDPQSLRRLGSIVVRDAADPSEKFFGAVAAGDGGGILIADGQSRAILRWTGDRRDVPETLTPLPGHPRLLRGNVEAGMGVVLIDNSLLRFRTGSGEIVDVHTPRTDRHVKQVEILSDGSVVYGTDNGEIWRTRRPDDAAGEGAVRIGQHTAAIWSLHARGDRLLASGDASGLVVFHPQVLRTETTSGVALGSPVDWLDSDGARLYAGLQDGTFVEMGLDTQMVHRAWPVSSNAPIGVVEREGDDGHARRWVVCLTGELHELDDGYHGGPFVGASAVAAPSNIAFSADGSSVAFTAHDGYLHVVGEDVHRVPCENRFAAASFDRAGRTVVSGGLVVDVETGEELLRWWPEEGTVMSSRCWGDEVDLLVYVDTPDALSLGPPSQVWTWNRARPDEAPRLRGTFPGDVAWLVNPQFAYPARERTAVLSRMAGGVLCLDLETVEVRWTAQLHAGEVVDIEIDETRGDAVSVGKDGSIHSTDLATGRSVKRVATELEAFTHGNTSIAKFSVHPSGDLLATTDRTGALRVWTFPEGRSMLEIDRQLAQPRIPRFTPDGRWLAYSTHRGGVELLGHGAPPEWARSGRGRATVDAMLEDALDLMTSEPLREHHVVTAGSVVAVLGGRLFDEGAYDSGDPRLAELRAMLDPFVVPTDMRMFRDRSHDHRTGEVGRFGFRPLDAFRSR